MAPKVDSTEIKDGCLPLFSRTKIGKSTVLFAFIFIGLSSEAPPLDVSDFFGIPAAAPEVSTPTSPKDTPLHTRMKRKHKVFPELGNFFHFIVEHSIHFGTNPEN
jgi:hypothetical protein